MKVVNHKLTDVDFVKSPNQSRENKPQYLVVHFTAGRSDEKTIARFERSRTKASAHLVIGRDGKITQMVPFNKKAWHAGRSEWTTSDGKKLEGMNGYSIGIELSNYGKLERGNDGKWYSWFGVEVPDKDVCIGTHKSGRGGEAGWHRYTSEQLEALEDVAEVLFEKYKLKNILGHDDIAPGRKTDPGPAFPMDDFRSLLLGRDDYHEDWTPVSPYIQFDIFGRPQPWTLTNYDNTPKSPDDWVTVTYTDPNTNNG